MHESVPLQHHKSLPIVGTHGFLYEIQKNL